MTTKERVKKVIPKKLLLWYHRALAVLAKILYGNPSGKLTVIGVTGTDGKTSSVILISEMLEAAGIINAYMTTAEFKVADRKWVNETKQTMPGRFQLQKLLRQAVDNGCTHVAIETSSQGIEQFRHIGVTYDVAVFTNLSEDHIEAHGSFEKYRSEKVKLFKKVSHRPSKRGVPTVHIVNATDPEAVHFLSTGDADLQIGFMIEGDENTVPGLEKTIIAKNDQFSGAGLIFDIESTIFGKKESHHIETSLVGRFNIYNILGAVAAVRAIGVGMDAVEKALKEMVGIPGRLEVVGEGQDFSVIVDYAHAENALENVFQTVKPLAQGKVISVLGSCGGGRDIDKRPRLGKIAAEHAEIVIVTNEDPYDEDPLKIIDQVAQGVQRGGKVKNESYFVVPDRRDAIELAIKKAEPGDVILLTGKGSEQCIMSKDGEKIPWDDRKVVREILRGGRNSQI